MEVLPRIFDDAGVIAKAYHDQEICGPGGSDTPRFWNEYSKYVQKQS